MEHEARDDGFVYGDAPRCPRCGAVLCVKLLTFEEEPGSLLLFDCPRGDFHATATKEDIIVAVAAAVKERLRFG